MLRFSLATRWRRGAKPRGQGAHHADGHRGYLNIAAILNIGAIMTRANKAAITQWAYPSRVIANVAISNENMPVSNGDVVVSNEYDSDSTVFDINVEKVMGQQNFRKD